MYPDFLFPSAMPGEVTGRTDGSIRAACPGLAVIDPAVSPAPTPTILWSGTLADDRFSPHPANWSPAAWSRLDAAAKRWQDAGAAANLLIRTHAAHIISDAPSSLRFAKAWSQHGVRLVYDLASMFTPHDASGPSAPDLLRRRFDALCDSDLAGAIAFVLVANVKIMGGAVEPAPINAGILPPPLLHDALAACRHAGVPTALIDTDHATLRTS